ncbi:DUF4159 domain-containing protein [Aureimonas altamirensis]|uniref:DUF4159 domain-containing protein n=1 Tax=Aureimonas altamirensis TaxID=370622 RepID=UPI0025533EE8|nr:DUF4159 domain-containing protein [Aureimonas altamirensis]
MGGLALSFGAPLVLFGLVALPIIWWLLRLTPPQPETEAFPPFRILQRVLKTEETPARSPWWLTLLRLLLAGLVILALAAPVLNPREALLRGEGPLGVMLDNGWASATRFDAMRDNAAALVREAGEAGRPVSLVLTAEDASDDAAPMEAATALERLGAAEARPVPVQRLAAAQRLATALQGQTGVTLALLTDGLESTDRADAMAALSGIGAAQVLAFQAETSGLVGLTAADNATDALTVAAVRPTGDAVPARTLRALDRQSREIGRAPLAFDAGATATVARFDIPVELRNDVARIELAGTVDAGSVRLVDDSFQRRRVGLISGEPLDLAQPLLSPLYYITRALEPFADLVQAESADLATSVPAMVRSNPSAIVLADIGVLPAAAETALTSYVEAGGTLLRFAGPRLAASTADDQLVPVRLRSGERQLGGALSWSEPQALAPMAGDSPFADIAIPSDVTVTRQILAEPSVELADRTWASLADGTPIVTAATRGAGRIILFHTTAEATWSNLPISGAFVDMLRRIVMLSRAGTTAAASDAREATYPPYLMLDADGLLVQPDNTARPLTVSAEGLPAVTREHPPGLYGSEEGYVALNLLPREATLSPIGDLAAAGPVEARAYGGAESTSLTPWLFAAALLLFALDALALIWLQGGLRRLFAPGRWRRQATLPLILAGAILLLPALGHAQEADDPARAGLDGYDAEAAIAATATTHLAYVRTGDAAQDEISRQGLFGLSQFIGAKTALEPGEPVEVDIATDELSFYPILYWPVSASAPMPAEEAISRVDAYMKQGGTVLFDVEDSGMTGLSGTAVSDGQRRLRAILADLDIPPLEPVPADHVLTKSFYIMDSFPGRYTASDLWVEALARSADAETRPATAGDGVSSIMITSNDFASAWAVDDTGLFVYPTDTPDPAQRDYAYRAGVNIVMYVLTGNYKADQVHVPALLERLGQ